MIILRSLLFFCISALYIENSLIVFMIFWQFVNYFDTI